MKPPRGPLFLERETYLRRRVMDGARILPVAGFVLVLLPVLWSRADGSNIAAEAIYLFVLWCALILAAAILARPLRSGFKRDALAPARPVPRVPPAPPPEAATDRKVGADPAADPAGDAPASSAAAEPPR